MNVGYNPTGLVDDTDLILVLECDAPWLPSQAQPPRSCKVIQCGYDPLFTRIPIRGFPSDIGLVGGIAAILSALTGALERRVDPEKIRRRRETVAGQRKALTAEWETARSSGAARIPLAPAYVSRCISNAKDADAI